MPDEIVSTGTENATTTAPAATTPTVAPATSTSEGSKPPSALASLEKVASAASSAETNDGTAKPVVQPTSQASGDPEWDRIPEARRNTILQNARIKERESVMAEFGWAKDVKREDVSTAFGLARQIHSDPVKFVVDLISEIRQQPQLARTLEQALGPAQPSANTPPNPYRGEGGKFAFPKPKLMAEDGKTGAYTSDQMAETLGQFEQYLMDKFGDRLQPVEDAFASAAEREEVASIIHTARQEGSALMSEMRALEHWPKGGSGSDGEKKIASYLGAIPQATKEKIGSVASLYQAFNTYLQKDVYPTLRSSTEQTIRDDNRRRVAASTGTVVPGTTVPQPAAKKPSNVSELARHLEQMAGATQ